MDDWGYIPLSQLSQAGYCLRRAALLVNEQIWSESADTAKGRAEHERTHTRRTERRGNSVSIYEYDVFSDKLGINGKCDCLDSVRFYKLGSSFEHKIETMGKTPIVQAGGSLIL